MSVSRMWQGSRGSLRLFSNIGRLFGSMRVALAEPEVQGVLTLALTLIAIAALFYWIVEGWSFLDAVYFSVVTIATVGFGDLAPQTVPGKIFTIVYIIAGIGLFASAVATLARAVLRADSSGGGDRGRSGPQP
ncbi:potassium channel family protein [Aestuariivirga sp.]|uniref:potassium channel family protein n=1 Tax=Aestuariivirga sp. TaxID=2650926 RepID=UPI0035B38F51